MRGEPGAALQEHEPWQAVRLVGQARGDNLPPEHGDPFPVRMAVVKGHGEGVLGDDSPWMAVASHGSILPTTTTEARER
jgi:hypothetical protein